MLGGRRVTGRLARRSGRFQMSMGAIMVMIALLMLGNYDTRFETSIASDLPSFLVDPDEGPGDQPARRATQLAALRGHKARQAGGLKEADAGLTPAGARPRARSSSARRRGSTRPANTPLSLAGLRGHVVLVDFWTYSCINCIRTLPYLNAWNAKYASKGLTIVGVHTPEFPFEHSASNVAEAIRQNGIHYPVVAGQQLRHLERLQQRILAGGVPDRRAGPHPPGRLRRGRIRRQGAGDPQPARRSRRRAASGRRHTSHAQAPSEAEITPESYLGAEKAERFENGPILHAGLHDYRRLGAPRPPANTCATRAAGGSRGPPTPKPCAQRAPAAELLRAPRVPRRGLHARDRARRGCCSTAIRSQRPRRRRRACGARASIGFQRLYRSWNCHAWSTTC